MEECDDRGSVVQRNEDILYICYDNEIYGNTGGQRSSATPEGAVTSTTPRGKTEWKKDMVAIMAAHRIPSRTARTFFASFEWRGRLEASASW